MISIASICLIGIITAVISLSIRRQNSEIAFLTALAGCVIIFVSVVFNISSLLETLNSIFNSAAVKSYYIKVLVKAVGICFLCEFAVDLCVDAGQRALANNISIAGKALILITAAPLYKDVLNSVLALTQV